MSTEKSKSVQGYSFYLNVVVTSSHADGSSKGENGSMATNESFDDNLELTEETTTAPPAPAPATPVPAENKNDGETQVAPPPVAPPPPVPYEPAPNDPWGQFGEGGGGDDDDNNNKESGVHMTVPVTPTTKFTPSKGGRRDSAEIIKSISKEWGTSLSKSWGKSSKSLSKTLQSSVQISKRGAAAMSENSKKAAARMSQNSKIAAESMGKTMDKLGKNISKGTVGIQKQMQTTSASLTNKTKQFMSTKTMVSRASKSVTEIIPIIAVEVLGDAAKNENNGTLSIRKRFQQGPVFVLEVDLKGCDLSLLLSRTLGDTSAEQYKVASDALTKLGMYKALEELKNEILPQIRIGLMLKLSSIIPNYIQQKHPDLAAECIALEDAEEAKWLYNFLEYRENMD